MSWCSVAYFAKVVGLNAFLDGKVRQLSTGDVLQMAAGRVVPGYPAVLTYLSNGCPAVCEQQHVGIELCM